MHETVYYRTKDMPEERISIRAFVPDDWDVVCGIYERAAQCELALSGIDPEAFRPLPDVEVLDRFQRLNTAIVACVAGRVVGFAAWRDRGEWRGSGFLSWLYVEPAFHRRGIGDRLMQEALAALGGQAWTLAKPGNDPAICLYRKHGMRIVKSVPSDGRGCSGAELRLALPTSRKADPDVPNFGA